MGTGLRSRAITLAIVVIVAAVVVSALQSGVPGRQRPSDEYVEMIVEWDSRKLPDSQLENLTISWRVGEGHDTFQMQTHKVVEGVHKDTREWQLSNERGPVPYEDGTFVSLYAVAKKTNGSLFPVEITLIINTTMRGTLAAYQENGSVYCQYPPTKCGPKPPTK